MTTTNLTIEMTQGQFEQVCRMLYDLCGITLHAGKEMLVRARLAKRLRALSLGSIDDYLTYLKQDTSGQEITHMIDVLTTNKTSFFREAQHFDYLREHVLPGRRSGGGSLRIWSAGCSTGEEPYSLTMLLHEELSDAARREVKLLATDISTRVLATAREGIYDEETARTVPPSLLQKYFACLGSERPARYRVKDHVRSLVRFARLNLMEPWPMRGPFDIIFCRNVMIYFDKPTQRALIHRFWEMLAPSGLLFVGHSESLTGASHEFRYVQPAVYAR